MHRAKKTSFSTFNTREVFTQLKQIFKSLQCSNILTLSTIFELKLMSLTIP